MTYDGTIDPNEVRLYGAVDGGVSNGLEDHVDITVEQGDWNGKLGSRPLRPAPTSNATTIFAADTITAFTTANYDYAHAVAGWNPASRWSSGYRHARRARHRGGEHHGSVHAHVGSPELR
ncbi:MAG: hypothetical protein R2715_07375 [Ilumatobacteraceae bacterium]